jgi:tight adherence protein B
MSRQALFSLLFGIAALMLLGLFVSGIAVMRMHKLGARRDARVAGLGTPRPKVPVLQATAFTKPTRGEERSIASIAAAIFGFDLNRSEQYPLSWWMILLLTLAASKGIQMLANCLVGELSYLAIPGGWVILSRAIFNWSESRRQNKLLQQFPDALAMIVRSVRVGIPVMEAMRAVSRELPAPTGPEFHRMVDQVSIGVPLDEAVVELAQRAGIPEYRFFATTLSLQNQTGGTLSESLDNLADMIRKRIALIAKGNAMASEAKTCAAVLTALPIFTGLALYMLSPDYFSLLFDDPTGRKLFGAAVLSLGMGLFTIRTMIRKSLS